MNPTAHRKTKDPSLVTLFLCGDVMTGRAIDQILPHPNDARLYEPCVRNALEYIELAEEKNGPIPRPVDFSYIWGDALSELERVGPDLRIINLETTITQSEDWVLKGINYRMHPDNIPCLTAAQIDACALANNHLLDFGYAGLSEMLETLAQVNVKSAGAGRNRRQAEAPAVLDLPNKGRVLMFAFGTETSGIPLEWAATEDRPGVNFLEDLSERMVQCLAQQVGPWKQSGDLVVASIHWGGNWGYRILPEERSFAHRLIDEAGVDILHGHSSHHPKGIEVYGGKPILYGCGDFITDYEGIPGYEEFRGDLGLMYFVTMNIETGALIRLEMVPTQRRRLRVNRASSEDARRLEEVLNRENGQFGTRVDRREDNTLELRWNT